MIYIYRFFYLLLKTLAISLKPFLNAKTQRWIAQRSAVNLGAHSKLNLTQSIWIHASSGEIEYAKYLILKLNKLAPHFPIVVTYSSESAEKLFDNIRHLVEAFVPVPWDDVYSQNQFIRKINPQILIIARTDLWPEMLEQCSQQKISIGLISYFPKFSKANRLILKVLLNKFTFISCVDQNTENELKKMRLKKSVQLRQDGDTRFDQVFARISQDSKFKISTKSKIFTFGSTWPEDELQFDEVFAEIISNQHKIILSPHDVSEANLARVYEKLQSKKYSFQKLSESDSILQFDTSILVIDRIGYLADAYRYSQLAFVGGSFKARVHSVMEPLCCGLPVLVGPFIKNSPEALKYSQSADQKFVFVSQNAKELLASYKNLNLSHVAELNQKIKLEMQKNQGASERIAMFISDTLLKK